MASADPQTMRADADDRLAIDVTLPTNFKVAPFTHTLHQMMLEQLSADIDASKTSHT